MRLAFARLFLGGSLAGIGVAGCTVKTIEPPLTVTTKHLPELAGKADESKEVTGSSCARAVLLFIPVGFATAESAYADALAKAPGTDAIVDYEVRGTGFFVFPFYYEICTEVHGYAVSSKSLAAGTDPEAQRRRFVADARR